MRGAEGVVEEGGGGIQRRVRRATANASPMRISDALHAGMGAPLEKRENGTPWEEDGARKDFLTVSRMSKRESLQVLGAMLLWDPASRPTCAAAVPPALAPPPLCAQTSLCAKSPRVLQRAARRAAA